MTTIGEFYIFVNLFNNFRKDIIRQSKHEKSIGISLFWFLNFFFWLFIRSFIQSNQEFHVADLTWPISCLFNFMGISSCVIPSSVMPVPRILEQLNSWRLNGRILMYLFFLFLQNSIHRRRKFLIWKNNHE